MKKFILSHIMLLSLVSYPLTACATQSIDNNKVTNTKAVQVKTGFNQNFSMMPNMTAELYNNIQKLKPQILRYPGGTVTHNWDWKNGTKKTRKGKSVHKIKEIKTLTDYTGAKFVFVLDILNSSVSDQVEMLKEIEKLGVSIDYIELGNELYGKKKDYIKTFPTGKDYADKVNQWLIVLRKNFPQAKIGALLSSRKVKPSNTRLFEWNRQVVDNTIANVDAYTYHIYINEKSTFERKKREFIEVSNQAKTKQKELWITEYGNKQDKSKQSYYTELNALANFVESYPKVTIALNHQIIGGSKNKLTEDGKDFVKEGQLFLQRLEK